MEIKWVKVVDCGIKKFYLYHLKDKSVMVTFIGDFECRADAKGRIVLPAAFKKAMGQDEMRFVVRKDLFENCLVLYPYDYWEEELDRLREKLNPYNRNHKQFLRDFFRGSAEVTLDGNGRFLIPRRLMEQVGAERDIVMVGVDRHIELWASDLYHSIAEDPEKLGQLAESILGNIDKSKQNDNK
ncbi:division/cell wall cluster transcriptional repressor MraZ [Alkalitalea saponilacus]|uniref:Transcriptional regulator MraZ n=1 Tax=Alkalitalea saponilacus TaxID=889453 RepID=A0A1T5HQW5_9BACT|nr:division/cell wall cluster transcriptional repressor MraZ [Alkalitalea saponilacus]SKC23086.1 MraZ protein [Alkalitalea saponilacus]